MRSQSFSSTPGVLGGGELGSWNHPSGGLLGRGWGGAGASAEVWRGCPAIWDLW